MHEIINRRAANVAFAEAPGSWSEFAIALGRHASDADNRKSSTPGERPRHFIDIDAVASPPFDDVPRTLDGFRKKYGADSPDRWGSVPWAIEECWEMLVLSFARGDWASAGAWGADLGHYVADSHQPLHCTVNYDGQRTGNQGVHLRFEVMMMDRHFDEDVLEGVVASPDVERPIDACFAWIAQAYEGLDAVLDADTAARAADSAFGDAYYATLWSATELVATLQMERAVRDLAALYRAAWEEGGRPQPPNEPPAFRAQPREVLDPPPAAEGPSPVAFVLAGLVIAGALVLRAL